MANPTSSLSPQRSSTSLRKTNKPLMEKRRRARINESLTLLKSLVIQSSKKDSSQFNKLEKADILELTVKHLRTLQEQHQHQQIAQASDPTLAGKYQAGFMECANEVIRYIGQSQGFTDDVKCRVIHHLASCVQLSNKTSFTKPVQQVNNCTTSNSSIMSNNGLQTMDAKLPNGQIIQIVSNHFQNITNSNNGQFNGSQPIPIAAAASSLPGSSSSTHIPVIITSDPVNKSSTELSHVRYTQPLHIQIPPVLSPVNIQPKAGQHHKLIQPQVIHKIQDTLPQITCSSLQQETLVSSSSTPSPQPTDIIMASPTVARNQKSHIFYTHDDNYSDFMPRSRTYSLASSISTESELTSPLNLSQSPKYYDQKEINYSNQIDNNHIQPYIQGKTSPTQHYTRNNLYQTQLTSSNFTSVIVDGRKTGDGHALKYMHIMDEDRMFFRHDGTSSPASSVGEERLWRPW
uniref:Uncharacterized protein n=1 Tax=Arion vulgaris TaxID=1028688 RepID=A0A0B7AWD0_9EUPU